ncbi:MAG: hypothetical protein ABEI31_01555 [Halodesulfurarchaeum sp.]
MSFVPDPDAAGVDAEDGVRDRVELAVIPPAIEREELDADGRVGAVAYPYIVYDATVTLERPFVSDRTTSYVVSVDRSRRLALRADTFPEREHRTLEDVLVLPDELTEREAETLARDSVFKWTLRTFSVNHAPDIELTRSRSAHKLFWIVDGPDGEEIVDSVRGERRPLRD